MSNVDNLTICNIFIDLARKGSLSNVFKQRDIRLHDVGVEVRIITNDPSSANFPTDIMLYSRKLNYFLVVELKDGKNINLEQALTRPL